MSTQLTPEAEEKLRALARKISLSNELAPDLQEELYGHLEDKTLGYLSGDEAVSVDDAVLLTREHFGDPRMLKSWLSSVHIHGAAVGTSRRLAAMAILMLATVIGVKMADLVIHMALLPGVERGWMSANVFLHSTEFLMLASLVYNLCAALQWQRRENRGEMVWYARWSRHTLGTAIVSLLAIKWAIPSNTVDPALMANAGYPFYAALLIILPLGLGWPMLWLWWANRPPRRWRACLSGLGAFFFLSLTESIFVGRPIFEIGGAEGWRLTHLPFPDTSDGWIIAVLPPVAASGIAMLAFSAAALAVYAVARMIQRTVHSRAQRLA